MFLELFVSLTAGCSCGRGVSNCGVISRRDSCFTPSSLYASMAVDTNSMSMLVSWGKGREFFVKYLPTHYLENGCTRMEKSSASFSFGGDNLKRYFDQK